MRDQSLNEPCSCGPGCDCGCCEGTEPRTPRPIANRPGLNALSYRVGTHSSFLETMKARLSSQAFPVLAGLTTREPGDVSLALLDAWAVVADVLTFYQERNANEGYLRTATERRSVLELARLVGYTPRPGVAASTYLAYLLDEGPETLIPAGAAARSVPGPGEKPQTFETTDDLVARAEWNNLRLRLTRPQQPKKLAKDWKEHPEAVPLYFKGISTNLKPNDPLLIATDPDSATLPTLYRVLKVDADAVNDRTRVEVQLWVPPAPLQRSIAPSESSTPPPEETAEAIPAEAVRETGVSAEGLRESLERASDLETLKIFRGAIAKRVLSHLEPVKVALDTSEPELRAAIEQALPRLREEHGTAVEKNATRLEPWIGGLIAELEGAAAGRSATPLAAHNLGSAAAPESLLPLKEIGTVDDCAGTTDLSGVLASLGKPQQRQLRSSAHLQRDPQRLFGSRSDLSARMLTAAKTELADVLYTAWANVPVTKPPTLKVCALRTRASVFGHNAPREFVRREEDGVVITETREWSLEKNIGRAPETFSVALSLSDSSFITNAVVTGQTGLELTTTVTIGSSSSAHTGPLQEQFTLNPGAELVEVTVSSPTTFSLHLELDFKQRGFVIDVSLVRDPQSQEQVNVTAQTTGLKSVSITKPVFSPLSGSMTIEGVVHGTLVVATEEPTVVWLDVPHPQLLPESWIVLQRPSPNDQIPELVITRVRRTDERSRAEYGIAAKVTRIELDKAWLELDPPPPEQSDERDTFAVIRGTAVFAQCEELELAEEPIDPVEEELCGGEIELARLYDGLQPGRWLIVSGERTDVAGVDAQKNAVPVSGVPVAELAMVAAVEQGVGPSGASASDNPCDTGLPGERTHTTLTLARPLAYCYKLDTVRIYGNVAHATHGETRFEVLGSGDAGKPFQSFILKQPPLTWISAPTPSGVESTLKVRVNDILWHAASCPAGLGPADRSYFVRIGDGGQTTVVFGDGKRGARLPTGTENVRAAYRSGIGNEGNVKTGQISQLATRPLGVKDVINPIPATGGAGAESRDQARRNAPLAVMALDRLVSVQDYADFARTFAGVGKTSATRISDGRVELVHVTIAGEDDIPIREDSDLFLNLEDALLRFGEPRQPLALAVRQRFFLIVEAEVRVLPDFLWDKVEPKIRAAMAEAFGVARRDLGQDALLSQVYRTIQGVSGVDFVDVNLFTSRDPEDLSAELDLTNQPQKRVPASLARIEDGQIKPAQLLYLAPDVPDTLILKERKS